VTAPAVHDLEARALWHLQLDPAQLFADCVDELSSLGLVYCDGDDAHFDYDEDGGPDTCPHCAGTGGDPYNDYILPCEYCDGEGVRWWM
jgi:phytoene dehydrogenase-like protein